MLLARDGEAAVLRDRARCARIVAHGINNGCVRQAAALAFDTDMSSKTAIATLDDSGGYVAALRQTAEGSLPIRVEGFGHRSRDGGYVDAPRPFDEGSLPSRVEGWGHRARDGRPLK